MAPFCSVVFLTLQGHPIERIADLVEALLESIRASGWSIQFVFIEDFFAMHTSWLTERFGIDHPQIKIVWHAFYNLEIFDLV